MTNSTLTQIQNKLKYDCNIFDGTFIDIDTELLGYLNEAIDDCEALIHKLYEDYFYVISTFSLVSGTNTVSLPSDIFANKIRFLGYNDGSNKKYEIKRFQRPLDTLYYTDSNLPYKWLPTNTTASGQKIMLFPTPNESNSFGVIHYIRNAKKLVSASDECDIPEFINFIYAHTKWNIARKEKYGLDLNEAKSHLEGEKELLETTLSDMVVDEGNTVRADFSFYNDFDTQDQC